MRTFLGTLGAFAARAWFPLALLAVFALALPGVVLFVLHLLGLEPQTNTWLQENYQVSYHMALPWGLALTLLLLPLVVLLLYFLKLKRRPLQVPSTFLWKKSIEDLHVNSLFQWLRRNLLLLLQLLILLVLIYAVMGFRVYANLSGGRHYVLMIDNSASMATKDADGLTRLEWARREALKEIDAATDRDSGMVIVFNSKATTLQTYTTERGKLRAAVRGIGQTQRPTRIEEALNLADSLANPLQSTEDVATRPENEVPGEERQYVPPEGIPTEVFLYSDGRFPDLTEAALSRLNSRQAGNTSALGNITLNYRGAGKSGPESVNNLAVVALSAVRLTDRDGKLADPDSLRLQVLARVRNYRPLPAGDVKLNLDLYADGQLTHPAQKTLTLPARQVLVSAEKKDKEIVKDEPGEDTVSFELPAVHVNSAVVLHAYLSGHQDDFAADDQAWLAVGQMRKARVLIVTPGNPILSAFFDQPATRKVAALTKLSPDELAGDAYRKAALSGEYDLVIFDRCAPPTVGDLPQANTFFVGEPPPPWQRGDKVLRTPLLTVARPNHPLLRQLTTLWDIGVTEAFAFDSYDNLAPASRDQYAAAPDDRDKRLPPEPTILLEGPKKAPVLFTLPRGAYADLVLAFPLVAEKGDLTTNWPLQPSFPLFLRNVLYVLGGVNDAVRPASVRAGEPMVLRPEAGVFELAVTDPAGRTEKLRRGDRPDFVYAATEQLGSYAVERDDGATHFFAVNLLDPDESNTEPRAVIRVGDESVRAGAERRQPREIWKWVVLVALGLLLAEWYVYNKRVYV